MVPAARLERVRSCLQGILSPWCLPFHHAGIFILLSFNLTPSGESVKVEAYFSLFYFIYICYTLFEKSMRAAVTLTAIRHFRLDGRSLAIVKPNRKCYNILLFLKAGTGRRKAFWYSVLPYFCSAFFRLFFCCISYLLDADGRISFWRQRVFCSMLLAT